MALREVNLVPTEILMRRRSGRHILLWAGCLMISLAVIFGFHLYQTKAALAQKNASGNLNGMQIELTSRIEEINHLQEELDRITQKRSVLESIIPETSYSLVLSKLAGITNASTWLTHLAIHKADHGEQGPVLEFTGVSFYNEDLGDFLNRLSSDPAFNAVVLKYARETQMSMPGVNVGDPMRMIQFQIECTFSGG